MKRTVSVLILCMCMMASSVQALSWAYPFVVWNGKVYEVKEEAVLEEQIGKRIGEVKTRSNDMTGNYYGNASNVYPKGTAYFEIKNISTEMAIAVEAGENQWKKGVYVNEAPFHWMNVITTGFPFLIPLVIVVLVIMRMNRTKKNGI